MGRRGAQAVKQYAAKQFAANESPDAEGEQVE